MAQETAENFIGDYNDFTIKIPNVIIDCGNAKILFDKQQIQVDDMLDVYIKLKNYLNTFNGVYL